MLYQQRLMAMGQGIKGNSIYPGNNQNLILYPSQLGQQRPEGFSQQSLQQNQFNSMRMVNNSQYSMGSMGQLQSPFPAQNIGIGQQMMRGVSNMGGFNDMAPKVPYLGTKTNENLTKSTILKKEKIIQDEMLEESPHMAVLNFMQEYEVNQH